MMTDLFELLMIVCFGISWPLSVVKSYKARTAKGKSVMFEVFIMIGYCFGIARKVIMYQQAMADKTALDLLFYLAWFFYFFNLIMILIDIILWIRNSILDRKHDKEEKKKMEELQNANKEKEAAKETVEAKEEEVLPEEPVEAETEENEEEV